MHRHGISHALGYLCCSIASGVIVDLLKKHYPKFNGFVTSMAIHLSGIIEYRVSPRVLSVTFVACLIAFVWGVGFKLKFGGRK